MHTGTDQDEILNLTERLGNVTVISHGAPDTILHSIQSGHQLLPLPIGLLWSPRGPFLTPRPPPLLRSLLWLRSSALLSTATGHGPNGRIRIAYATGREAAAKVRGDSGYFSSRQAGGRKVVYVVLFGSAVSEPFITCGLGYYYLRIVKNQPVGPRWLASPLAVMSGPSRPEYLGAWRTQEASAGQFAGVFGPWTAVPVRAVSVAGRELVKTVPCLLVDIASAGIDFLVEVLPSEAELAGESAERLEGRRLGSCPEGMQSRLTTLETPWSDGCTLWSHSGLQPQIQLAPDQNYRRGTYPARVQLAAGLAREAEAVPAPGRVQAANAPPGLGNLFEKRVKVPRGMARRKTSATQLEVANEQGSTRLDQTGLVPHGALDPRWDVEQIQDRTFRSQQPPGSSQGTGQGGDEPKGKGHRRCPKDGTGQSANAQA
ncbi:Camk4 [Symbiodinium sp. CCMP2592]|nr:Camk4 [Symbiodinium sp. CCMP2592]